MHPQFSVKISESLHYRVHTQSQVSLSKEKPYGQTIYRHSHSQVSLFNFIFKGHELIEHLHPQAC